MAKKNMKIKAKVKKGLIAATVKAKHEMLTYDSAKKKGKEANFITHVVGKIGDKVVYEISSSQFLAKDPDFKFKVKPDGFKDGDKLEMTWTDLSGKTVTESKKIKGLDK
jgi:sulfur-oxidizing protein SoxZ